MENKKWRPQDYFGWSEGGGTTMADAMKRAVGDLKSQAAMIADQERILGKSSEQPVNASVQRRMMLMKQMGVTEDQHLQESADRAFYARPEKQQLIKDLGLSVDQKGVPVLDDDDENRFNGTVDQDDSQMDRRTKMLHDLLVDR